MELFDQIARTDHEAKADSVPTFSYWNQSARSDLHALRQELEKWFRRYPEEGRLDLRNSFRSRNDSQHRAAFFELFLHEVLLSEFGAVEIHPKAGTKGKQPDFLVNSSGERFFVEAVSTSEFSDAEKASEARKAVVRDALDRARADHFWIGLTILKESGQSPPAGEIVRFVEGWLGGLDVETEIRKRDECPGDPVPSIVWSAAGWSIKFDAYATRRKISDAERPRLVGVHAGVVRELHHRERLLAALKKKAKRYGRLDAPFLIVVDIDSMTVNDIPCADALFGEEYGLLHEDGTAGWARRPNGLWHDATGPINRGISGVVFVQNLKWWTLDKAISTMYPNPCADAPYRGQLERLRRLDISRQPAVIVEGQSIGSVIAAPGIVPIR